MARAWVIDLWQKIDPETGKKIHTERFGSGSRWRVDWYELQPDGTKRLRSRTFPIKAGAEEFATRTDHETRAGSYRPVEFGRKPFVRASESWLAGKKKIKPSTRHSYDRDLRTHILPRWGAVAIGSITRHDIETWVTQLQDGTAPVRFLGEHPREASGLSAASIDRLFAITSAVLSYSHKAGWLPVNPANGVELPTILRAHHIYLSYAEVELLADAALAATSDETDRVLIHTLAYTGMRINEALALTVGDLHLETRRATVKATWSLNEAGERVTGTPKTGSTRSPAALPRRRTASADHGPLPRLLRLPGATGWADPRPQLAQPYVAPGDPGLRPRDSRPDSAQVAPHGRVCRRRRRC